MTTATKARTDRARTDQDWMDLALELAEQGEALTSPNPMVGCVIVRDGQEVGRGFHTYEGVKHAEVLALESAGDNAKGATLYINLEPCSHTGRTGPCTDAILEAGIARVVAAMPDPNPTVNGASFEKLRAAGVEVTTGVREEEARRLNEAFACWIRTGRPFVTLKAGLTLDGRIARDTCPAEGEAGSHLWITSEESRLKVQSLRHQADALITGIGTVLSDNPNLTDRTEKPRRRPLLRVVLDAGLRIPLDSNLVQNAGGDVLVVTGEDIWQGKRKELTKHGVETIEVKESGGRISLPAVLKKLAERDITSVLTEAGSRLNGHAIDLKAVDKVWLFYAPKFLGSEAVPLLDGRFNLPELLSYRLHRFENDFAVEGYLKDVYGNH